MPTFVAFDPLATNPNCLVTNELIALQAVSPGGHLMVVPRYAPFYEKDFSIEHVSPTGIVTPMVLGVHYLLGWEWLRGENATQLPVWGCVSLLDNSLSGSVRLTQYRSVGSAFHQTTSWISEALANQLYSPRVVAFDQVANLPAEFPPAPHPWDVTQDEGITEVVSALDALTHAIGHKNNSIIQVGLVLSSVESSLSAGVSNAHLPITHNQRLLGLFFSLSTASSAGDIRVMPLVNGTALLTTYITIAAGQNFVAVDTTTNPIVQANLALGQRLGAEVIAGFAGTGAKGLTMTAELQYLAP